MGWTFTSNKGSLSSKEYMDKQFTWENETASVKVLDSSVVGWNVYYGAVERTIKATGDKEVSMAVALLSNVPKAKDGFTFGYKDMDEGMGPNEAKAPLRLMKLLSPLKDPEGSDKYVADWRAKVYAYHAKPKVKAGSKVKFANELSFGNYGSWADFTYEKGSIFTAPTGMRVRITSWKGRAYEVVA